MPNDATIRSGKRHGTNDVPYVFVYRRFCHVDVLYRAANGALSCFEEKMRTLVNDLRTHLPYARRFARALSGSQQSGDAYILQTLESLVADRSVFDDYENPKLALYASFLKLWNSVSINKGMDIAPSDPMVASADRNLQALTPRSRQAFLLVSMEGFTEAEAADILGLEADEVTALIDEASQDIASQVATDVLIIEDEPLIAMDLEALMEELGHRVIGMASTHAEAVVIAKEKRPGLVLSDIQLADGSSGLDAVNDILANYEAPVVFITAFPERLLTGEKPEPAFLITKPFEPTQVKSITSQALFFDQKAHKGKTLA
jgi:DNA-directed RNA polymerase specialized sigma24 family protein